MKSTSGRNRWKRGLFRILEVSCALFWVVSGSSQESLVGEFVSKMVSFVEYIVVELLYYFGIELLLLMFEFEVWVVLLGVIVALSGEYGADGL